MFICFKQGGGAKAVFKLYIKTLPEAQRTQKIDSVTWIKFSNTMTPLALVTNFATRWRHLHKLQIWQPDGATCISCKFGNHMATLALFPNLATRWHHLHWLQIWLPDLSALSETDND